MHVLWYINIQAIKGKQASLIDPNAHPKCLLQILIRDTINLHRTLELSVTFFVLFLSSFCDLTVIGSLWGTGDQRCWALESLAGGFASVPIDINVITRRFLRITLIQRDEQFVVSAVVSQTSTWLSQRVLSYIFIRENTAFSITLPLNKYMK